MRKFTWIICFAFLLFGCTTAQTPTPTAEPATSTARPTQTPPPTSTPTPIPTATETDIPTETPLPTETSRPTRTPRPTKTATPVVDRFPVEEQFTIYGDEPAVPNNNIGPNGQQYTDPGGVIFHDGKFHMFHNAFTGWPASVDVMYSVSDDGINWELAQAEPVFEGDEVEYAGVALLASSIMVLDDGTWAMYLYSWDDFSWPVSGSSIALATAPNPTGPWTALDEPILRPGSEGEWDDLAVRTPSVIRTVEGYEMFYGGFQRGSASIGRATSADGLTWVKDNDPDTTEAPLAESDPIFSGSGADWDWRNVYQPRVRQTDSGLVMLYTSASSIGGNTLNQEHGLAYSKNNGEDWIRSGTEMFKARDVKSQGQNIWYTELEYALDRFFIFLELGVGNKTEIYVAEFDVSLLPD